MNDNEGEDTPLAQTIIQLIENEKPQDVHQLISSVRKRTSFTETEITEQVIQLQNQGKIRLNKPPAPVSQRLGIYLKASQALWYWIVMILATTTAATLFIIPEDAFPMSYIRYFLGAIFVIWLPGYSLVKALFPIQLPLRTPSRSLDNLERLLLSICMSFVLVPMVGLLLNFSPWGIRLAPVTLSLLALVTVLATAGIARESRRQARDRT